MHREPKTPFQTEGKHEAIPLMLLLRNFGAAVLHDSGRVVGEVEAKVLPRLFV